jgi:hypothetical protein
MGCCSSSASRAKKQEQEKWRQQAETARQSKIEQAEKETVRKREAEARAKREADAEARRATEEQMKRDEQAKVVQRYTEAARIKAVEKQAEIQGLIALRAANPALTFDWGALTETTDLDHVSLAGVKLVDSRVVELTMNGSGLADTPSLADFSSLSEVWFSDNPLTTPSLERFCRTPPLLLAILGLENCEIEVLPDSVVWLPNLKELYLARNKLQQLPASIHQLSSLRHLTAADNPLADAEKQRVIHALPNCIALYL